MDAKRLIELTALHDMQPCARCGHLKAAHNEYGCCWDDPCPYLCGGYVETLPEGEVRPSFDLASELEATQKEVEAYRSAPLPPKYPEPEECPNCHQPYALDHGDDLRKCVARLLDRMARSRQFYALRYDTMNRIVRERGSIDADAYWNIAGNGRPSPVEDTPEIELVRELNRERSEREVAEKRAEEAINVRDEKLRAANRQIVDHSECIGELEYAEENRYLKQRIADLQSRAYRFAPSDTHPQGETWREVAETREVEKAQLRAVVDDLRRNLADLQSRELTDDAEQEWPLLDVLSRLADFADDRLTRGNYDGHGHESLRICVDRARAILSARGSR